MPASGPGRERDTPELGVAILTGPRRENLTSLMEELAELARATGFANRSLSVNLGTPGRPLYERLGSFLLSHECHQISDLVPRVHLRLEGASQRDLHLPLGEHPSIVLDHTADRQEQQQPIEGGVARILPNGPKDCRQMSPAPPQIDDQLLQTLEVVVPWQLPISPYGPDGDVELDSNLFVAEAVLKGGEVIV